MKKITHFGKYYYPETGGIESVTSSLASGAALSGYSVVVVCFRKKSGGFDEVINNVRIFRSPINRLISSQPLGIKYLLNCIKESINSSVVHLHAPNMLGALCAIFLSKKIKLLVHWHSDVVNKGILGHLMKPLEYALLRRADVVVATSRIYAEASKTLMPFKNKITVIPIGIKDVSNEIKKSAISVEIEKKIVGKKIILSVGRLVSYKGFDVLIEAAKYIDDAVVLIVGEGDLYEHFNSIIKLYGVSDKVFLVGRLSNDELGYLFSKSNIYCMASIHRAEAFGVVLLEAMAYGLPIIATAIPGSGVSWVNKHGVSGINVPVGDAKALARACNDILGSDINRERFSVGARERFLREFTEDVSVNNFMKLYDGLTANLDNDA